MNGYVEPVPNEVTFNAKELVTEYEEETACDAVPNNEAVTEEAMTREAEILPVGVVCLAPRSPR